MGKKKRERERERVKAEREKKIMFLKKSIETRDGGEGWRNKIPDPPTI